MILRQWARRFDVFTAKLPKIAYGMVLTPMNVPLPMQFQVRRFTMLQGGEQYYHQFLIPLSMNMLLPNFIPPVRMGQTEERMGNTQQQGVPTVSLRPPNPPLSTFSSSTLDGSAQAQVPLILAIPAIVNSHAPLPISQDPVIAAVICASAPAVSQTPPSSMAVQVNNDTTVAGTDSSDSFINIDPLQASAPTHAPVTNHCSSLAIANANKVHNFGIEACDTLEQLSTAAARITNNVPTIQTIDQIIGAISDQYQAQQIHVQCKIQEQAKSTNACFTALAEQLQKLISTTTAAAAARNPPTPRPPLVTSWFHVPVFYQLTIGEQGKSFTNVQQLANAVAKACSVFNATKAQMGMAKQPILVNQADQEMQQPRSPQPSNHCFDRRHSMNRSQDPYRDGTLSTDRHPQNTVPPPNKFISFQPQPLKQPPQSKPRAEMLLEQLIQ
uniref:Uncharacterized protein n=1 Tax=Romanomermis culicivorax TaxID=13658 RepID=A0A915K370_ROMCU